MFEVCVPEQKRSLPLVHWEEESQNRGQVETKQESPSLREGGEDGGSEGGEKGREEEKKKKRKGRREGEERGKGRTEIGKNRLGKGVNIFLFPC